MIIDKFGIYKARNGEHYEVVYLSKKDKKYSIIAVNLESNYEYAFTKNGNYGPNHDHPLDLIEYIGPELPKDPRKFEFEAYLGEHEDEHAQIYYSLENQVGHLTSPLYTEDGIKKMKSMSIGDWPKYSKWRVVMEEILDEV